jgi:L-threonylcarbamoyladenylate synthase
MGFTGRNVDQSRRVRLWRSARLDYDRAVVRILRVDPACPEPAAVEAAAAVMRAGGLVAFPTETVYGLGARALDARAVERVFAAKGRPPAHPIIVHVASEADATAIARAWPHAAAALARAFWPGPLTLVVPRAPSVPDVVTGRGDTVGVRAPSHPVARALLAAVGEPVAAPSANRYQSISPTTARHVVKSLGDAVDLVLDAGPCPGGIESTVVDVTAAPARVLRLGGVDAEAIARVVGDVRVAAGVAREADVRASPGMAARHYAPRVPLRVALDRADATGIARAAAAGGGRAGLVFRGGEALAHTGIVCRVLPGDPSGYARDLFAALHDLEDAGATEIVVEPVPEGSMWAAVADRLRRAGG